MSISNSEYKRDSNNELITRNKSRITEKSNTDTIVDDKTGQSKMDINNDDKNIPIVNIKLSSESGREKQAQTNNFVSSSHLSTNLNINSSSTKNDYQENPRIPASPVSVFSITANKFMRKKLKGKSPYLDNDSYLSNMSSPSITSSSMSIGSLDNAIYNTGKNSSVKSLSESMNNTISNSTNNTNDIIANSINSSNSNNSNSSNNPNNSNNSSNSNNSNNSSNSKNSRNSNNSNNLSNSNFSLKREGSQKSQSQNLDSIIENDIKNFNYKGSIDYSKNFNNISHNLKKKNRFLNPINDTFEELSFNISHDIIPSTSNNNNNNNNNNNSNNNNNNNNNNNYNNNNNTINPNESSTNQYEMKKSLLFAKRSLSAIPFSPSPESNTDLNIPLSIPNTLSSSNENNDNKNKNNDEDHEEEEGINSMISIYSNDKDKENNNKYHDQDQLIAVLESITKVTKNFQEDKSFLK